MMTLLSIIPSAFAMEPSAGIARRDRASAHVPGRTKSSAAHAVFASVIRTTLDPMRVLVPGDCFEYIACEKEVTP